MKYYIGLDMGTSSLGWAVTDDKYRLLRKKGKDMWGVRLFDEADTAAARRTNRVAKRRRNREKARIGYLKELFATEIEKIDSGFYQRLDDSKFWKEDKTVQQKFALFADTGYTDVDYYKEYPTIFHLRKKLLESTEPQDVRLVYLAILNIYKHRGHFLNANLDENGNDDFADIYANFVKMAKDVVDIDFSQDISDNWLRETLSSSELSKTGKHSAIIEHYGIKKSAEKKKVEMLKLICGLKGVLSKIFEDTEWEDEDKKFSISYRDSNYDETSQKAEELLSESAYELFCTMKQMHDWSLLANIMKGEDGEYKYLSLARVAAYEKHQKDLKILKKLYKDNDLKKYNEMFRIMNKNNYSGYVGSVNSDKDKTRLQNVCRYGGVTDIKGAYFCLVEHTQKKKRIRTIEPVPLYLKHQLDTNEKLEKYFAETYGYENPNVRIEKIKVYSLIKVNGFYMYLTGRTGAQLAVCNAVQMILPWKWMLYVKEMTKAIGAEFTDEYMEKTGTISKSKNRQLYDLLCEKHLNCIYKLRPNPVGENLIIGKDKFNKLSILEQIYVLLQILQLSQLINQGANLELIGLAKKAGTTKISKNISNCNEFKLINQSITGLYENEADLLTI